MPCYIYLHGATRIQFDIVVENDIQKGFLSHL